MVIWQNNNNSPGSEFGQKADSLHWYKMHIYYTLEAFYSLGLNGVNNNNIITCAYCVLSI